MALNFKDLFDDAHRADTFPLTDVELGYIKEVEDYIDETIRNKFNSDVQSVSIFLGYPTFRSRIKGSYPEITSGRKSFMFQELMSRYEKAGWKYEITIDDGLDGNMSGSDYLILKGWLR